MESTIGARRRARCGRPRAPRPGRAPRRSAVLVKVAVLMPVLVGMLGVVLDVGLLLAAHRQVHNAADAGALAAAMDLVRGRSPTDALATANRFVQQYNGLATARTLVRGESFNSPPESGPYAGGRNFVEVIVTQDVETLFIQVLGAARLRQVQARAVAGFQPVAAGEGVMVLDRTAVPGLRTSSNIATLQVNGRIVVNSEGGGVDETGADVGKAGTAASAGAGGIYGTDVTVVGGVNSPANFFPYVPGEPNPLHCRQLPEPDPLTNLPTPTTANGVDPTFRGDVQVTNNNASFSGDAGNLNFRAVGGEVLGNGLYVAQPGQVILHPGIYRQLSINGGNVLFMPGIYVLSSTKSNEGFKVTGGTTVGNGVMLYSTGSNYDPVSGTPDVNDRDQPPPHGDGALFGSVEINASIQLTPIDTKVYNYAAMYPGAPRVSDAFDGMLFYQRRRNTSTTTIVGNAADGGLTGTLYAKWARFDISGQGAYDAQFLCGSMDVTGQGNVKIHAGGKARGRANQVFLVE